MSMSPNSRLENAKSLALASALICSVASVFVPSISFGQGVLINKENLQKGISAIGKEKLRSDVVNGCSDDFSQATVLDGPSGSLSGSFDGATSQAGEPAILPSKKGDTHSLWCRWRAPANGNAVFEVLDAQSPNYLAIYASDTFASMPLVSRDAISGPAKTHGIGFLAQKGSTYSILIDANKPYSGKYTLKWSVK